VVDIHRHFDGRTAVIGAHVTPVPKSWPRFDMVLDGVPVTVAYDANDPDDGATMVLVNGCDIGALLDASAWCGPIANAVSGHAVGLAQQDLDDALELRAEDVLGDRR